MARSRTRTLAVILSAMRPLALAAAVVAAATAVSASPAATERRATLRLVTAHPITLRGTGFDAAERVQVTVHSSGFTRTKQTRSNDGAFTVTFRLPFDRCNGLLAVARGSSGTVARYKLPQLLCPPRQ